MVSVRTLRPENGGLRRLLFFLNVLYCPFPDGTPSCTLNDRRGPWSLLDLHADPHRHAPSHLYL